MNIGMVCYPTYGGSGVVATELGIGLAKRNHEVHFVSYGRPPRLNVFQENICHHEVNPVDYPLFVDMKPYESAFASKLVDVVKHASLDILHVHYAIPHAAVAFMAKEILKAQGIHIPVITTLHGSDITLVGKDPTLEPIVSFSINQSDGITCVSEYLREVTIQNFQISKEIEVIYNFIDFERFYKVNKDHFKKMLAPNGEKILTHVSNFRKVKRVSDVVNVFSKVHKEMPAKLLMIGDGPERPPVEALVREYGLERDVRFLGKQDAIGELLAIADLFLIPSGSESFGLAALEAMACEVPVLSSNVGGLPEVNIHGQTGYLSDIGDVNSMADHAIELLRDTDRLNAFRKNALERAKTFHIDHILPQYEALYEKVLAQKV